MRGQSKNFGRGTLTRTGDAMTRILTALLLIACFACAPVVYKPGCAQIALFAATTINDRYGYPTRISVGPTDTPGVNHAVAQAFIDGKWRTLKLSVIPYVYAIDYNDEIKYYTPTGLVSISEARRWVPVSGE